MFWNGFYARKSIFMQLLESPIPPLTATALMTICKRPVLPDHNCKRPASPDDHLQEAGPSESSFSIGWPLILTTTKRAWKMHFWDPSQQDKMCVEYQRIKFYWKKIGQNFCTRLSFFVRLPSATKKQDQSKEVLQKRSFSVKQVDWGMDGRNWRLNLAS